ncbi:MAG: hypothetical protein QOG23_4731 [Blastocatellia bacterium]|nr:hypothetical protein [Blastocatellia bacterium]
MEREVNLLELLAYLYDTRDSSRTLVDMVHMDRMLIEFKEGARDNWNIILIAAGKQRKLEALVQQACSDYPERKDKLIALLELWSPAVTPQPSPAILPSPQKYVPSDPDLLIARELHWNRISVATTFLGMIKGANKYPYGVMGLQDSRDADLDSLIDRFEEMCQKAQKPKPLLHAKILLSAALPMPSHVALEVLEYLRKAAINSEEAIVNKQAAKLARALDDIDQSFRGSSSLTPRQLAIKLNDCLEDVARDSTVVLLLQRFHELSDESRGWLRDAWVVAHACKVKGLVTVISGETGLEALTGQEPKGIFFLNQLPSMTWEDFLSWAREGFGFDRYNEDLAQKMHYECKGYPREFLRFLKLRKMEDDLRG